MPSNPCPITLIGDYHTPIGRDRDRPYIDSDHEIARLGVVISTLRNDLDTSIRAQHASTRKISNFQEEIENRNDEIMKLKNHLDNSKNDNRRLSQELRSLKDDNDYVNKYDHNNIKLENESLKINNKNLKNSIENLINDQQREKFTSNLEIDNLKGEKTRLNAQLSSNELSPGVEAGRKKLADYAVLLELERRKLFETVER
jgi:chromosome segregation ATPase